MSAADDDPAGPPAGIGTVAVTDERPAVPGWAGGAPWLSIVLPVLDEAVALDLLLDVLAPLRRRGVELIVVDGGSDDDTVAIAISRSTCVLSAPRGRARQMHAGVQYARGQALLFLHADSVPPVDVDAQIAAALGGGAHWGRFDVRLTGSHAGLGLVAALMNRRSRLTGIATGDQAIFVRADSYARVGGYPDQPLMEDIALSRRLKRLGRPVCLAGPVLSSGRRWEVHGYWRTIGLMWALRFAYFCGVPPRWLARCYGRGPRAGNSDA